MSSNIQINDDIPQYSANVVPCKIHYNGPANTQDYYTCTKTCNEGVHESYFRGCKFVGKAMDIENYNGYIIEQSEGLAPVDNDDENEEGDYKVIHNYATVGQFNHIVVYGHDRLPPANDQYGLMSDWEKISRAIHSEQ